MFEWLYNRLSLDEISGAFGDIGTVIPITLAMAKVNSINIFSSFFWYGVSNLFLGYYDLPMTVQPQKTISALAIKGELNNKGVICAGFLTGIITSFLAVTGLLTRVSKIVPSHLISVIQMSQGLIFIMQGMKYILNLEWIGVDSYITSIITGIFILITWLPLRDKRIKSIPSALVIFIIGIIIAGCSYKTTVSYSLENPFIFNSLRGDDFLEGFKAMFTQLPLTLLNSVISTVELSHTLFPDNKLNINNIAYTIGGFNLFPFIGASPCCLGCGSLASNYKFGGRSGLTPIIIGLVYILFSVFFGSILLDLLTAFPNSMLGVMLIVSGGELSKAGAEKVKDNYLDYSICVGICLSTNLYTGFLTGIIIHMLREIIAFSNRKEEDLVELITKENSI